MSALHSQNAYYTRQAKVLCILNETGYTDSCHQELRRNMIMASERLFPSHRYLNILSNNTKRFISATNVLLDLHYALVSDYLYYLLVDQTFTIDKWCEYSNPIFTPNT